MTKTESAEHTVKTLAIESCEQWLNFKMSAGVRAAIPGTDKLIMVGPADWIAKNVPDAEELIAAAEKPTGDLTDERAQFEAWMKTRLGYPFAGTFTNLMWDAWQERAAIAAYLARQSQAAQQLTENWTPAEQAAFSAWAITEFPNESSQGLISLGSAWKQGQDFGRLAGQSQATKVQAEVKIERGHVWIVNGNQSFMLAYVPDEGDDPAEMEAYANNLRAALSTFTPDVNSGQAAKVQAVPDHDQALKLAEQAGFINSAGFIMPPRQNGHITSEVVKLVQLSAAQEVTQQAAKAETAERALFWPHGATEVACSSCGLTMGESRLLADLKRGEMVAPTTSTVSALGSADEWISTDDSLPDDDEWVAILFWPYDNHDNEQVVGTAQHRDGTFHTVDGDEHHTPSHWARLPLIPRTSTDQADTDTGSAE